MSVHLCVENSFSWWNSLFLFSNLKHQIDWYIKHTKDFLRVPCGIHSGLLCYHEKQKQLLTTKLLLSQLLPNLCQFSGSAIISENSEDKVCWLFYWKQLLSKSFSARSVLGKPCSKQVSSTELIDSLPEWKKTLSNLKQFRYVIENL